MVHSLSNKLTGFSKFPFFSHIIFLYTLGSDGVCVCARARGAWVCAWSARACVLFYFFQTYLMSSIANVFGHNFQNLVTTFL